MNLSRNMAYATDLSTTRIDIIACLRGWASGLLADWNTYRTYRATLAQLEELSERELLDLGLSRSGLKAVARESAYGAEN